MELQYRILSFSSFLCIFLVIFYFLRPRLRYPAQQTAAVLGAVVLACAGEILVERPLGLPLLAGSFLRAVGLIAAATGIGRRLTDATLPQILFFTLFLKSYSENLLMLMTAVMDALGFTSPWGYVWGYLLSVLLTLPLVLWAFTPVVYSLLRSGSDLPFWRFLWLIPLTLCALYYIAVYTDYLQIISTTYHFWTALMILIWVACTISIYYFILKMLQSTAEAVHWKADAKFAAMQLKLQREQMQTLQNGIEESRRIRHDVRHHVVVLKNFAQADNQDGLLEYLSQYESSLEQDDAPHLCANDALDAVLGHYYRLCRRDGISFTATANLPSDLGEAETDFCLVLGNLLENAWEECRRLPPGTQSWIHLKAAPVSAGMLALTVRNSCRGLLQTDGDSLLSSKHSGRGTGTNSVRHIAAAHGGTAQFTLPQADTFEASVLLRIPSP